MVASILNISLEAYPGSSASPFEVEVLEEVSLTRVLELLVSRAGSYRDAHSGKLRALDWLGHYSDTVRDVALLVRSFILESVWDLTEGYVSIVN